MSWPISSGAAEAGTVHLRRKDFNSAAQYLTRAHELEPQNRDYAINYGLCLARAGKAQEAVVVLSNIMTKADAYVYAARMLIHLDRPEQARQYVEAALMERPTHPEALRVLMQFGKPAGLQGPVAEEREPQPTVQRATLQLEW